MTRIIIESQSNPLFLGSEYEQSYDQRGGLCHADGPCDLVVTGRPYDPSYLRYWGQGLGMNLPRLLTAGNHNPSVPLSDRIRDQPELMDAIRSHGTEHGSRIEFFCIEQPEIDLATALGLPVYTNLPVARRYASKPEFHRLACEIGLPTVDAAVCHNRIDLDAFVDRTLAEGGSVLVKGERGTGGVGLASAACIFDREEIDAALGHIKVLGSEFLAERLIPEPRTEVTFHWETGFDRTTTFLGCYDQFVESHSYVGAAFPSVIVPELRSMLLHDLWNRLIPAMTMLGHVGYACVDVNVTPTVHWMDLNPRKGAIRYIHDAARRMFPGHEPAFWHSKIQLGRGITFSEIERRLGARLVPDVQRGWAVLVTNPGVYRFGTIDLTGVSLRSRDEAHERFLEAREQLLTP